MESSGSATSTLDTTASGYDLTAGSLYVYTAGSIFNANSSIITLNNTYGVFSPLWARGGTFAVWVFFALNPESSDPGFFYDPAKKFLR